MLENIGRTELIIVGVILLVLLGPKKLPEFARGLGEAVKEVRRGFAGDDKKEKAEEAKK